MTATVQTNLNRQIHFACLALMAASLPLSFFGMSVSGILLAANWLIDKQVLNKFKLAFSNKTVLAFLLIFAVHAVGLLYTSEQGLTAGLNDIRIKLPLLLYPIVLGSSPRLSYKQWYWLFVIFIAACAISCGVSFAIYFSWINKEINDFRSYSPFISHIRLSLLLVVALVVLALNFQQLQGLGKKIIAVVLAGLFLATLNILQSATGFGIICCLLLVLALRTTLSIKLPLLRWASFFLLLFIPFAFAAYLLNAYFNSKDKLDLNALPKASVNGEKYWHFYGNTQTENGHYVFYCIAEDELKKAWSNSSDYSYYDKDAKGHMIYTTIWRYMSSKNLRKDSLGFSKLTKEDVKAIEQGETNCNYSENIPALKRRRDLLFAEADNYFNNNINGNSLVQRLEYVKTGWRIFKQNYISGVGTGDLQLHFDQQYENDRTSLDKKFRLRAHNQYLTFAIAFGLPGFLIILFALIYPAIQSEAWKDKVFISFLLVALLSFVAEDTLETQAGVSFFTFFYGIFVWAKPRTENVND